MHCAVALLVVVVRVPYYLRYSTSYNNERASKEERRWPRDAGAIKATVSTMHLVSHGLLEADFSKAASVLPLIDRRRRPHGRRSSRALTLTLTYFRVV